MSEKIQEVLKAINKKYGNNTVHRFDELEYSDVEAIPTGALTLDYALGIGGIPRGRIVEIVGPPSGGKSTLAQSIIGQLQKNGGVAAYIDAENAVDRRYAEKMGIDLSQLILCQPSSGEEAFDVALALAESNEVDLIVIDSVAALTPKAIIEGEMDRTDVASLARLMGKGLAKLNMLAAEKKTKTTVLFINQLRHKVGVVFGNTETTPGGESLKFFSSVRIDVRIANQLKEGDTVYGNRVKVKIIKNKVAPPFRTAEFEIIFGKGINEHGSIIELALQLGVLEKSGSWVKYNGEQIGQGLDAAIEHIDSHSLFTEIEDRVRQLLIKLD
jgi:recombination protein RecA